MHSRIRKGALTLFLLLALVVIVWLTTQDSVDGIARPVENDSATNRIGNDAHPPTEDVRADSNGDAQNFEATFANVDGAAQEPIAATEPDSLGYVDGRVIDSLGNPISGVRIILGGHPVLNDRESEVTSGLSGKFELALQEFGFKSIAVEHPDYDTAKVALRVAPGQTTRVNITMNARTILEGTVYINGEPAPYQQIEVQGGPGRRNYYTETDVMGAYRVERVQEGVITVVGEASVSGSTISETKTATSKVGHTTTVDFDFSAGTAMLSGKVIWGEETPADWSGVVQAHLIEANRVPEFRVHGIVSSDNTYQVSGLLPGTYSLTVEDTAGRYRIQPVEVVIVEGESVALDVEMEAW